MKIEKTLSKALDEYRSGNIEAAHAECERALRDDPGHADALHLHGVFSEQLGQVDAAVASLRKAVALHGDRPEYHDALGTALAASGDLPAAVTSFERALAIEPGYAAALFNLGNALLGLERYEDASDSFEKFLEGDPGNADALVNLAVARWALQDHASALTNLKRACDAQPTHHVAWKNLANILAHLGYTAEADSCYRKAVELRPTDPDAFARLGWFLFTRGDYESARDCFKNAIGLDPACASAAAGLAALLERFKAYDEALEVLAPHLEMAVEEPRVAVTFATLCRRAHQPVEAVPVLDVVLQHVTTPTQRSELLFALGSVLDDAGEYDEAFEKFAEANSLQGLPYDAAAHRKKIDREMEAFAAETYDELTKSTETSELPVFIVGMPRSGTSLVEQILSSHPAVRAGGELEDLRFIAADLGRNEPAGPKWSERIAGFGRDELDRAALRYLERLRTIAVSASRVTDKMPLNFQLLGFISLLFPRARVIHCVRDPLDTCLSCFFQHFNGVEYAFSTSLAGLASFFKDYERLMDHWRRIEIPLAVLDVQYEKLVAAPETEIRRLVEFVGLPWDAGCLKPHENPSTVHTASYAQVQQPINTGSVGRSSKYWDQLRPLREELAAAGR